MTRVFNQSPDSKEVAFIIPPMIINESTDLYFSYFLIRQLCYLFFRKTFWQCYIIQVVHHWTFIPTLYLSSSNEEVLFVKNKHDRFVVDYGIPGNKCLSIDSRHLNFIHCRIKLFHYLFECVELQTAAFYEAFFWFFFHQSFEKKQSYLFLSTVIL